VVSSIDFEPVHQVDLSSEIEVAPVVSLPNRFVPAHNHRTLILGAGDTAQQLIGMLAGRHSSYEVIGAVVPRGHEGGRPRSGVNIVGTFADLFHLVEHESIQSIVVALDDGEDELPTDTLFDLKTMGIDILDARRLLERVSGQIFIERTTPRHVIFSDGFRRPPWVLALKRMADATIAAAGLVVLAPLFVVIGALIKADSRGPIFYSQLRIGLHGKPFTIWKFRSMRADAEGLHAPQWASEEDPRITRVGVWLRTWRLDELPQLYNVLRGEMSLVGPRPERPVFVQELRAEFPYYDVRHTVLPGLTGWAQVRFRYAASRSDSYQKLQYDLYYVKHMGLTLDFKIAVETLRVIARGEGAR
jgi:exopolysaccharide biosynthesis polyprenyl glycosylphosphotransferase